MCRLTLQIVALFLEDRSKAGTTALRAAIPRGYRARRTHNDTWRTCKAAFDPYRHESVGGWAGATNHLERWNLTLRQRLGRFVRKTLSPSKNDVVHRAAFALFIHARNLSVISQPLPEFGIMTTPASPPTKILELTNRVRGAIWGQFVGDAYCLGTHWIYDLEELKQTYSGGVQGFEVPKSDHYHSGKVAGDPTHYGDAALLLLQSVAARGQVDAPDFGRRFVARFGSADYHGYLDHSMKDTLANAAAFARDHPGEPFDFQQGGDDDQLATVSRIAPVVALAALRGTGQTELLAQVEAITRVTQNNPRAVAYAKATALVLAALLAGKSPLEALAATEKTILAIEPEHGEEVRQKFRAAADAVGQSVEAATAEFGQSCPLEHSFPSAVHCLLKHADSYVEAIHANAAAGGDNAGRSGMLGAWLGAHLGMTAIPAAWRERLQARTEVETNAEKLLDESVGG